MPRPSLFIILVLGAVLGACATPVAPSGGPADSTPPVLVETLPADGSTNVRDREIRLLFSERLAATAAGAVSVTPVGDVAPEVTVSGREVVVRLPVLRDSTTYVITVGTELADQRSVSLRAPLVVAVATGDAIDRGRIAGAVRRPAAGEGAAGLGVWAYALADTSALPDPRAVAPDYRTETGANGAFALEYLRPGPYFVVAVGDRNRNRRLDAGEAFATPPQPVARATADSTAGGTLGLFVTAVDTIPPVAQRLRFLSDRRFAVRFDEPVQLRDAAALAETWAVADSASGTTVPVTWYQPANADFEVIAEAARALPAARIVVTGEARTPPAVVDSAGLPTAAFRLTGTPPERPDTLRTRVEAFLPAPADSVVTLRRGEQPGVRFSAPPGGLLGGLSVEVDGEQQPIAATLTDGVTARPDTSAALPPRFALVVSTPDSTFRQHYLVPGDRDTGAILGRVTADGPVRVELRPEAGPPVVVSADAEGRFLVDGLLPGPYAVRVFVDRDGDGLWSGGTLAPYAPPEPLMFLPEPVTVRARWETEIDPVTL